MNSYQNSISEIWSKYKKRIDGINKNRATGEDNDYLIEDGIDSRKAEEYFSTDHKKVLFILKESNEESVDKSNRHNKSIFADGGWFESYGTRRDDKKALTKMIKMYHYIQNSSVSTQVQPVTAADIYKFAFININKHGNGQYSSNNEKIKTVLDNDKDLLKYQIEILQPDVIVFGVKALEKDFRELIYNELATPKPQLIVTCHFSVLKYEDFEEQV